MPTIAASTVSQATAVAPGSIVTVTPAAGASARVEYTHIDNVAAVRTGTATWAAWPAGTVTTAKSDLVTDSLYVRVVAIGGDVEVVIERHPSATALASYRADWNASASTAGASTGALGNKVWRGMGQAMALAVQGFGGATNWSITTRSRHYSNVRFRRVRAVIQTFYPAGTNPVTDTDFVDDYNFQVGFEVGYKNALTGIGARKMFTFGGGSQTARYLAASAPSTGCIVSDTLTLDAYVEAKDFFGLWTTIEATGQGANKIPYTRASSNYLQRFVGYVQNATSNIAADTARSATSITSALTTQGGGNVYFTPCMLLIETDDGRVFGVNMSDSIGYGVGEGTPAGSQNGDGLGSPLGNNGMVDRALFENLGCTSVNLSKGSDGNKFLMTPANSAKRLQLLALANPTHVVNGNVHNDITTASTAITPWTTITNFAQYDTCSANGNDYIAVQPGVGQTGATAPSGLLGGIIDGTVIWSYLCAHAGTSTPRGAVTVLSQMAKFNAMIAAAVPNAKIIGMLPTPDSTSTAQWTSVDNAGTPTQVANTNGWGGAGSRRSLVAAVMRTLHPALGLTSVFDPSKYLEYNFPTETSLWAFDGTAFHLTPDGTHVGSDGAVLGAAALTADNFV